MGGTRFSGTTSQHQHDHKKWKQPGKTLSFPHKTHLSARGFPLIRNLSYFPPTDSILYYICPGTKKQVAKPFTQKNLRGMLPLPNSRRSLLLRNPLGRDGNSLSERAGQVVRILGFIILLSPASRLFTRAQSESQSHAQCGTIMTKKLGQAFQGLRVQGRVRFALQTTQFPLETVRFPWEPWSHLRRRRNTLSPKQDQESTRTLSRGSRYGKGVRCPLPIPERGQHHRLTLSVGTTWAGTALTILTRFPHKLSGGQFMATQPPTTGFSATPQQPYSTNLLQSCRKNPLPITFFRLF